MKVGSHFCLIGCLLAMLGGMPAAAQVTYQEILTAAQHPEDWLTYSGDYRGWRYGTLDQINQHNVKQLGLQWVFNNGQTGKLEATPLVIDGIMYVSLIDNQVFALDARTGRQIWAYQRPSVQRGKRLLNGTVNRGVAVMGGRVYLATIDAYVVALDAQTGALLWETKAAETSQGYTLRSPRWP